MKWEPGLYKTRSGKTAEVLAVRGGKVIGWYEDDVETWNLGGQYYPPSGECGQDLIAKATGSEVA